MMSPELNEFSQPHNADVQKVNHLESDETINKDDVSDINLTGVGREELPKPLWVLFALNGASLSLPSLALMYIANTRAAVPMEYMSVYGALSFLPFSLKPIYAYLSLRMLSQSRHLLISLLLGVSAATYVATILVPSNGVGWCLTLGFVRGVASAWPEFLLGITLIGEARQSMIHQRLEYEEVAAIFQSQAATARNTGAFLATVLTFFVFLYRHTNKTIEMELSDEFVTVLLLMTASLPLMGSLVAWNYQVGTLHDDGRIVDTLRSYFQRQTYTYIETGNAENSNSRNESLYTERSSTSRETNSNEKDVDIFLGSGVPIELEQESYREESSHDNCSLGTESATSISTKGWSRGDVISLVLFQCCLIFFALQTPIVNVTSQLIWMVGFVVLFLSLVISACLERTKSNATSLLGTRNSNIGLYLILRHSIPSATYPMMSYIYTLFQSVPLYLQILSLVENATGVLSSWTYGRFIAPKYFSGWKIIGFIVVVTVVSSLLSFLNMIVLHVSSNNEHDESESTEDGQVVSLGLFFLVSGVGIVMAFIGEWKFLPSVVLATTNVGSASRTTTRDIPTDDEHTGSILFGEMELNLEPPLEHSKEKGDETNAQSRVAATTNTPERNGPYDTDEMEYGMLVSCIDFGDYIGSWITVPIVSALGISRDTGAQNIDTLIALCAVCGVASLAFLYLIIPTPKRTIMTC